MNRIRGDLGPWDLVPAVAVFAVAVLIRDPDRADGPALAPFSAATVVIAAITCAVLVFRRRRPTFVLGATVAGSVLSTCFAGERTMLEFAALVALYTLACRRNRRATWTAWTVTSLAVVAADVLTRPDFDPAVLSTVGWLAAAAAAGDALAHRRAYRSALEERAERAERDREEQSRRMVAEERLRIARDLHDIIAHNMAVVSVQAGVAGYLLPDRPVEAQAALEQVRRAAAGVLDELSEILGVLRQDGDGGEPRAPAPGLADLDSLVDFFTAAGLSVDWSLSGRPREVGGGVDLVAYRVVQEALTNAQKHGTGTARLDVAYLPERLQLRVSNPVPAVAEPGLRGGHGLLGMRERASAVGGAVRLGADGDGTFRVQADLPLSGVS